MISQKGPKTMKLHELREKRAAAVTEMRGLADKAESESRDLTADEDKRFGELKAEIAGLDKKIERAETLANAERSAPAVLVNGHGDGNFETRARDFSVTRALRAAIGDQVDAGFEREMSAEVVRRSGRSFEGIAVPDQVFMEQRTLTVGGDAASLYPTMHRPDLFIDLLRARLVTGRLGATILDGLVGTNDIPRQIGSSVAQWVGEDGEITPTDADFDDVSLAPKTVGAITSFSRRTLINAQPSIENLVRRDLAAVVARAIDAAAMMGTGTGNMPTGIINTAGVHELTFASGPTWDQVTDFAASIESDDADIGSMGWAMTPRAAKTFRTTLKVSGDAGAGFLMDSRGTLDGFTAANTTALPDSDGGSPAAAVSTIIFGAWSQLLVGYWSGLDLLVNPYEGTAYSRGRVLVRAMRDCDVAVRHAESFAFADDLDVSAGE